MAKNKGILKTLAVGVLAVGVIGAGIGTAYHFRDNIKNWFDNIINPTPTPTPTPGENEDVNNTSGGVYVDGVEVGKNDGVRDMPKQITFTRYAKQATSNNTLTVTCTVLPDDTVNKKLTWTLQWADGGNHGTVTDYVKMTVNGDTSQCTIQALKEWTYKIKLVVKTTDGSNLSKECTLDYLGRNVIFDSQKAYNAIEPGDNIMLYVQYVILSNKVSTSGGTLAGNVVIDGIVISFENENSSYLMSSDDYGYQDFAVTSSSTFYNFYNDQGLADGYSSARDFMNDVNGKNAKMYVEYHLEYNGVTYLTKDFKFNDTEDQALFVGYASLNNNSYLKATSLSLNDTSFIF